jgi:hypothetical protein
MFALIFAGSFLPIPTLGGLFRAQIAVHDVLLNTSQGLNSSTTNLTNAAKIDSQGMPGPFDPKEQKFLDGLRLQPHEFQRAVYLFNTMDKDRSGELSGSEFSKGLSEEEPIASNAGKYLFSPLVQEGSSCMKPSQFYRFFALAIATPAQFAWQKGERTQLSEYFQAEKAQLLRLFITYDTDCNDGVSEAELRDGFNNTLLQTVQAAKIPVSKLYETKREMKFAEADFADFASSGRDGSPVLLSLSEFVQLGKEAHRKAYAPKSNTCKIFGGFSIMLILSIQQILH